MTGLLTRPGSPSPVLAPQPRWLLAAGAAAAAVSAAVGFAVLAAVTVLLWAVGPHPGEGLTAAPFRGASTWWLLAQHASADGPAGSFALAPLALTAGAAVLAVGTARWAARSSGATGVGAALAVAAGYTGTHVLIAVLVAGFTDAGTLAVAPGEAFRAAAVFGGLAALVGAGGRTGAWIALAVRVEVLAAPAVRGAVAGLLVLLGGGAAVVGTSLAVHHERTSGLFGGIGGGVSGGIGLVLLSLVFLPNAALWAVAVCTGPGIGLGTNAGFDLFGAQPGALPSFPLLGALPQSTTLPTYVYLLALLPLLAGVVVGWAAQPAIPDPRWSAVLALPVAAAVGAGMLTGLLAALSGGTVGGRLSGLGPSGGRVGLAVAGELVAVAVAVAAARHGRARFLARRTPAAAAGAGAVPAARRPVPPEKPAAAADGAEDAARPPVSLVKPVLGVSLIRPTPPVSLLRPARAVPAADPDLADTAEIPAVGGEDPSAD